MEEANKTAILVVYDKESCNIFEADNPAELLQHIDPAKKNWMDIKNIEQNHQFLDVDLGLHLLIKEDILNRKHLPKAEVLDDFFFMTLQNILSVDDKINFHHKSFLLGKNILYSFNLDDNLDYAAILERIKNNRGKIRRSKISYVLYQLIDKLIDNCFPVLEELRDYIETMEDALTVNYSNDRINEIMMLRKDLINIRRFILPVREVVTAFKQFETEITGKSDLVYFNDLTDHLSSLLSSIDTYREMIVNLRDLNTSNMNLKMNIVMKTLSIMGTVFLPLTFIAGVYGMNFKYMPELESKIGYPVVIVIMVVISIIMVIVMKRKKWF